MNARAMIDSGVEWIEEIPKDWALLRLKDVLTKNTGGAWGEDVSLYTQQEKTMVLRSTEQTLHGQWNIINPEFRFLSVNDKEKTRLEIGDILITKSSGSSDHIGKATLVTEKEGNGAGYSNFMQRLRLKQNVLPYFIWRAITSDMVRKQFVFLSNTTTGLANLNATIIDKIYIVIPPYEEQQSIADFLDHHVDLIDREAALIDQKIELLGEKRKALIFECVTGKRTVVSRSSVADTHNAVGHGDLVAMPTDKEHMVDSGVEWIGHIPKDWTVEQIKNIARIQVGKTPNTSNPEYFDGDIPWLTISDLNDDGAFPVSTKKTLSKLGSMGLKISPKGSVLVSFKLSVGKSTIAERDIYTNEAIATISSKQNHSNNFLYWSLPDCFFNEASENIYGAKILNQDKIHRINIALPLQIQQKIISKFLDHEISMINAEISLLKRKKDLLVEKRKALIFEAVTGKIDCRSWTA